MIDIISSSIRIGNLLKQDPYYQAISDFYWKIDRQNSVAKEYEDFLNRYLLEYGFRTFDAVEYLLKNNANNPEAIVRKTVQEISNVLLSFSEYSLILQLSKELDDKINEYVFNLLTNFKDFHNPPFSKTTPKLRQASNELSTAVIRSGVCNWINKPKLAFKVAQSKDFFEQYETTTSKFRKGFPYNKSVVDIIASYSGEQVVLARLAENQNLVRFLIKNGIVQGFFYKIVEINETDIIKIKESHKNEPIHPVAIRINGLIPMDRTLIFRYKRNNEISYLICRKINMRFGPNICVTNLFGYRYPTNEYSLFVLSEDS